VEKEKGKEKKKKKKLERGEIFSTKKIEYIFISPMAWIYDLFYARVNLVHQIIFKIAK